MLAVISLTASLKVGAVICIAIGLFTVFFVVANAPSRDGASLGTRGARRRAALEAGGLWPRVEPLVRWLGSRLELVLPERAHSPIDKWLLRAGDPLGRTPSDFLGLLASSGIVGASVGLAHAIANNRNALPYVIALGVLGAVGPWLRIDSIRSHRMIHVQRGLPPSVDILCLGLSAGLDFPASVRQFIEKSGSREDPLIGEFAILLSELHLGKSRREALMVFAERNPTTAVKEFVSSVVQAEQSGTPLASVFKIQADASRRRRSVAAEETAAKTGIKLMLPMMMVFASVLLMLMGPLFLSLGEVMK